MREQKETIRFVRGVCWVLAVLLTMTLSFTVLGVIGLRGFFSSELHANVATREQSLQDQRETLKTLIEELAGEYGFETTAIQKAAEKIDLAELNRETALWWTRMMTENSGETMPRWTSESMIPMVENVLLDAGKSEDEAGWMAPEICGILEDRVQEMILPIRATLFTTMVRFANRRVNVPAIVRIARELPLTGLGFCLMLGGLMILLLGRNIRVSLKYFGAALAGAGISLICSAAAVLMMNLQGMFREASESLADQYEQIAGGMKLECAGAAAVLLGIGFLLLILYRRRRYNGNAPDGGNGA